MKFVRRLRLPDTIPFSPARWPFFYGFWIVLCGILGILMSAPGQTIGVAVFTDYLIEALNVSRLQLSLAYMVGTIGSSLVIVRAGRLIDLIGARSVAAAASLFLGCVLLYLSRVDIIAESLRIGPLEPFGVAVALVSVTFGFLLLRLMGQGVLTLSSRTMVMRWFDELRGRVSAVVGLAISVLFAGSPLVFDTLIGQLGWRGTWVALGALTGIGFTIFILVFFRDTPEGAGLVPDGKCRGIYNEDGSPIETEVQWTEHEARRTYTFWVFNIGLAMFSMISTAVAFHVVSIFETAGLSRGEAVSIFLPGAVVAVVVNIAAGWLGDWKPFRYKLKYILMALIAGQILLSVGVLVLSGMAGKTLIIVGNGVSGGIFGMLSNVVWPRYFGRRHLGAISGANMAYLVFFSAVGPSIYGWSETVFGGYGVSAVLTMSIAAVLFVLAFRADLPVRPAETK